MVKLSVCIGSSCHLKGSYEIVQKLQKLIADNGLDEKIEMKAAFCMKQCQRGVSVKVNDEICSVSPQTAETFFSEKVLPLVQ